MRQLKLHEDSALRFQNRRFHLLTLVEALRFSFSPKAIHVAPRVYVREYDTSTLVRANEYTQNRPY